MTTLLKIRWIQIKRELDSSGPSILVIFGIILFLIYASYETFKNTPDAFYLTAFLFVTCLSVHFYRKDKEFVYNHLDGKHLEMYSEYLALTFPFSVTSMFTSNWFCYPVLLVSLYTIPFLKYTFKRKAYFRNISSVIPASDFEMISGFRKSFLYLIPLYGLAIGFCWVRIFPLVVLWFITVIIVSFYRECEPLHILKEGSFLPKQFLYRKLFQGSKWLLLLYIPVLILNTVFNPDCWLINLLFIPTQLSLLWFSVCLKYSNYQPNRNSIANNTVLSLVSLGAVVPYLLPVPLLMTFIFYIKAKNNLDFYLHD